MGIFMINAQLPPASSLERTEGVVRQIEDVLKQHEGRRRVHRHRRIGHAHQLVQPRVRVVLLQARAVGRAERAGAACGRHPGNAAALARHDPRCGDLPVHAAHDPRLRRGRRIQLPAAGQERDDERRRSRRADADVSGRGAEAARARQPVHVVQSAGPAGPRRARSREGAHARRADQRRVHGARRRPWAART